MCIISYESLNQPVRLNNKIMFIVNKYESASPFQSLLLCYFFLIPKGVDNCFRGSIIEDIICIFPSMKICIITFGWSVLTNENSVFC